MRPRVADYERKLKAMIASGADAKDVAVVVPRIKLKTLIENHFEEETIADGRSPLTGQATGVARRVRMQSMPEYLLMTIRVGIVNWGGKTHLLLQRFTVDAAYQPAKLAVDVVVDGDAPLDLEKWRGTGAQPGEQLIDASQMQEDDGVDAAAVADLVAMGFDTARVRHALGAHANNVEMALNWVLSDAQIPPKKQTATQNAQWRDGCGARYELVGFVQHLGRTAHSGHYVAYTKQDGEWILFNDEKAVKVAGRPPFEHAYLLMWHRVDAME